MSTASAFREGVQRDAEMYLADLVGVERAKESAARVGMAFASAARSAKNPDALYSCSRASIVACIAASALTGLMPGGAHPKVWLVPKKGELQWWLSHRGICVLALRGGYQVIAVPVHVDDQIRVEFGELVEHDQDPDLWPGKLSELRGVYLTVRRLSDGMTLARPWMPRQAIERRMAAAQTRAVWSAWPVEQAQKTAIKWAMARGYIPVMSDELDAALAMEPAFEDAAATESTGAAALGLAPVVAETHQIEAPQEQYEPLLDEQPAEPAMVRPADSDDNEAWL